MAGHPEVLHGFCNLFAALALNMSPMPWSASLPNGVLRGGRENAPSALAEIFRARASHRCAQSSVPIHIPPSPNKKPSQTYVLASFYRLWGAVFETDRRALTMRAQEEHMRSNGRIFKD
jgi:hypothetical protein